MKEYRAMELEKRDRMLGMLLNPSAGGEGACIRDTVVRNGEDAREEKHPEYILMRSYVLAGMLFALEENKPPGTYADGVPKFNKYYKPGMVSSSDVLDGLIRCINHVQERYFTPIEVLESDLWKWMDSVDSKYLIHNGPDVYQAIEGYLDDLEYNDVLVLHEVYIENHACGEVVRFNYWSLNEEGYWSLNEEMEASC